MPLYDYKCPNCLNEFEQIVKNRKEKVICPTCKAYYAKRMQAPKSNFKLSGDCWAKDGYTRRNKDFEKHMEY